MAPLPIPGPQRSWWLREALAAETDPAPAPPLTGEVDAEVAIIGGGYTGMWTAYFLSERMPAANIVLLEQDICGGGPSGRNGGFVHGWWENLPELARRYGRDGALAMAREADEAVDGIGDWCTQHDVDAWFTKAGYMRVNAFPAKGRDWDGGGRGAAGAGGWRRAPVDGGSRGPARLRLARISRRPLDAERGIDPASSPGARAPSRPPRTRRPDPRGDARSISLRRKRTPPARHR